MIVTKKKVPIEFKVDDISLYKVTSVVATALFLFVSYFNLIFCLAHPLLNSQEN